MAQASAESDIEALREEVKELRNDVASVTDTLKKVLRSKAQEGETEVQGEFERLYDQFKETYDSVRRESSRVKTGIEREVEERPFTTLIGAFIVGMILGKFMAAR